MQQLVFRSNIFFSPFVRQPLSYTRYRLMTAIRNTLIKLIRMKSANSEIGIDFDPCLSKFSSINYTFQQQSTVISASEIIRATVLS